MSVLECLFFSVMFIFVGYILCECKYGFKDFNRKGKKKKD